MVKKVLLVGKNPFPSPFVDLSDRYAWEIWLLKSTGTKTQIKIMYSWIVPDEAGFAGWQAVGSQGSMTVSLSETKTGRVEVLKCRFTGSGHTIMGYIWGMLEGKTLAEVELEDDSILVPAELTNVMLDADYMARPEVMLPVEHSLIPWANKATPSPTGYSVFVSQLFYLAKLELFEVLPVAAGDVRFSGIVKWIGEQLQASSGFRFTKESAPRFGNIEWFRFPVADPEFLPLVQYRVIKNGNGVVKHIQVFLKPQPNAPKDVLVRCRIINGEEVTLDEVQSGSWGNAELIFDYFSKEPVSEVRLSVWEVDKGSGNARILFEDSGVLVRTISGTMSIVQNQINSGRINLLDKLDSRELDKPVQLAKFHRTARASVINVGGYEHDPWVSSAREVIAFMQKQFPESSGARFFINGWDERLNASGQLSFFQWIMEVINAPQSGSLLLIDPFFDKDGIEIFANIQTANKKIRILTCTQHRVRSKSKAKRTPGILTGPAKKIQANCKFMAPLFTGLDITVSDLTSPDGGKKQLFHDRYIVLTDDKGFARTGYHLSNSIQGATRKEPILITPIPADVLPEILSYMGDLLDAGKMDSTKKTALITLFQQPEPKATMLPPKPAIDIHLNKGLQEIPKPAYLFANLLGNGKLRKADINELQTFLYNEQLLDTPLGNLQLTQIPAVHLKQFATTLNKASQKKFDKLMISFGQALARSHYYDAETNIADTLLAEMKNKPAIADKLSAFVLSNKPTKKSNQRDKYYLIYATGNFEDVLNATHHQLNYMGGDFFGVSYEVVYACKFLVKGFPQTAVKILEQQIEKAAIGGWNEADPQLVNTMSLISTINHRFLRYYTVEERPVQTAFLSSPVFRIRAAASAALLSGVTAGFARQDFDEVNTILKDTLPDDEYRLAISSLVHDIRLNKTLPQEALIANCYTAITHDWKGGTDLIERVVRVLAGPLKYSYSYSISQYFLDPLIASGHITHLWAFQFWNKLFTAKMLYREKLQKDTEHYAELTDAELTKSISYYFLELRADEEEAILDNWIQLAAPFWTFISQPFQQQINFYIYDAAAERIYWLNVLLGQLLSSGLLQPGSIDRINQFLAEYDLAIIKVQRYIDARGYSAISGLKDLL